MSTETNNYLHVYAAGVVDAFIFFDDTSSERSAEALQRATILRGTHSYYEDGKPRVPKVRLWRRVVGMRSDNIIAPQLGVNR